MKRSIFQLQKSCVTVDDDLIRQRVNESVQLPRRAVKLTSIFPFGYTVLLWCIHCRELLPAFPPGVVGTHVSVDPIQQLRCQLPL